MRDLEATRLFADDSGELKITTAPLRDPFAAMHSLTHNRAPVRSQWILSWSSCRETKKKNKKTQRSLCRLRRHRSSHVGPHGPLRTSPYQIWINHRMRQPLHFNSSIFMACLPLAYTHAHTQYPSTPSHAAICISPKTFKHNEYLRWNIIMLDRMGSKTPNTRLTFFFKVWTSPTYQKLMGSNLGRDPPSIQVLADKPINRREAHRWQHNLPGGGKKK